MGCSETREIIEARVNHLYHLYDNIGREIEENRRKLRELGFVPDVKPPPLKMANKKREKVMKYKDDYFSGLYHYIQAQNERRNMVCIRSDYNCAYGFDFDDLGDPISYNHHTNNKGGYLRVDEEEKVHYVENGSHKKMKQYQKKIRMKRRKPS